MDSISHNNSRRTKNYDKIKRLALKLQEPGNVKERRRLALELEQLMSSYDIRVALAEEATPASHGPNDLSIAATRCLALSTLWTTVFTAAIGFTSGVIKGENGKKGVKPTPADIGFPDKLLRAATGPDQAFDSHGIAIPKLNRKTVRGIVKFCLEMLDNDKVVECGGEVQMLEMLSRICSRPEYLGLIKDCNFQTILSEITSRLTEKISADIYLVACKAFDAFFETSSQLGHPFHSFLSDSLSIVSTFCRDSLHDNAVNEASAARVHMFNAAASMLFSHPEHAMGPMKRDGHNILRYCKKAYENAAPNHRDAFNKYLLAHLFVSQVAGNIQGRLSDDLGDLGAASLSEKHLTELLRLVVGSTSKVLETSESNAGTSNRRTRNQKSPGQTLWRRLDLRQRRHLELASRLLACAQRLFLAREGAKELPIDKLKSLVTASNTGRDGLSPSKYMPGHPRLSVEVLSRSPWMSTIVSGLVATLNIASSNLPTKNGRVDTSEIMHDSLLPAIDLLVIDNSIQQKESVLSCLAIVAACCECFPYGQCWASSPAENWQQQIFENENVVQIHACSQSDLGLLLHLLSDLLETNGRPDSESSVQSWILVCLTKLAGITPLIYKNKDYFVSGSRLLIPSWQRIWKLLFRKDLKYIAQVKVVCENSIADLVCILLTEMVRWKCTETRRTAGEEWEDNYSSFLFKNQHDVLIMEHLRSESTLAARSPFELVSLLIQCVGIAEPTLRTVGNVVNWESPTMLQSIRQRLVRFSLRCLEEAVKGKVVSIEQGISKCRLVDTIATCLVKLSTAAAVSTTAFSAQDSRFIFTTLWDKNDLPMTDNSNDRPIEDHLSQDSLTALWNSPGDSSKPVTLSLSCMCRNKLDLPKQISSTTRFFLRREEQKYMTKIADFVSDQESEDLYTLILNFVDKRLSASLRRNEDSQGDDFGESSEVKSPYCNLSVQVAAAKLLFSLSIARCDFSEGKIPEKIPEVLASFENAVGKLERYSLSAAEYFTISSDLRKLAIACIEINARSNMNGLVLKSVEKSCQAMLRQYKEEVNRIERPEEKIRNEKHNSSSDLRFSDDEGLDPSVLVEVRKHNESDSEDSHHTKRKLRMSCDLGRKRRKTASPVVAPPGYESALEIGKLLLTLNPTPSNANFVCESLLRTELDLEPDSVYGDMDLRLAEECIQMLRTKSVLLNSASRQRINLEVEIKNRSIPVMVCHTIDLIRACATSSSNLYMYGVEACADILVKLHKEGLQVSDHDEKIIIAILREESDAYVVRPSLALRRLQSATLAFTNGSDAFRIHFGSTFASIVKKSMGDCSFLVRRFAYKSAGVAMKAMDEMRVRKSVNDLTTPIFHSHNKEKSVSQFSTWFSRSQFADRFGQQDTAASDAVDVFESDSIFVRSIIAQSTQETDTFLEHLIELITMSVSRVDLQLLCYRSLERVACFKNFKSVQDLIENETEAILVGLFRRGNEITTSNDYTAVYSLCLTAPLLLSWLEKYKRYDVMTGEPLSLEPDGETEDLREVATMHFLSTRRNFLAPFLLLEHFHDLQRLQSQGNALDFLSESPTFRVLIAILPPDKSAHESIKKILKKHVIDVIAFCSTLICSGDQMMESKGQVIQNVLESILSKDIVEAKTSKNVSKLIQRIIGLSAKAATIRNIVPTSDEAYYRAVLSHMKSVNQPSADDLLQVGTSLTELAIDASRELDKSNASDHQQNNWLQFQILGRFLIEQIVRSGAGENLQLAFYLHTLTEILLKPSLEVLRPRVLELILDILRELPKLEDDFLIAHASSPIHRLLAACFHIHEGYQKELVGACKKRSYDTDLCMRRSCGIDLPSNVGFASLDEATSSSFKSFKDLRSSKGLQASCLNGTYDVIHWIIANEGSFGGYPYIFRSFCNPDEISQDNLNALFECEAKYCAQLLTKHLENMSGGPDRLEQCVSRLKRRKESPHGWLENPLHPGRSGLTSRNTNRTEINIDQRLLYGELLHIEGVLGETPNISSRHLRSLCDSLLYICNAPCPIKLRFAASQCLAMLKPNSIVEAADISNGVELIGLDPLINFIPGLHAKCIDCLAESLKSSQTEVSSTAKAILKGLLSTNPGIRAYKYVIDSSKSLLKPFVIKRKNITEIVASLSDEEVVSLVKRAGVSDFDDRMWCWNSHLWEQINYGDVTFEEWICAVATAIILCCFQKSDEESSSHIVADGEICDFFWQCQKGTSLDHRFASAIFPCLILAILDIKHTTSTESEGRTLSGGNKAITRCFKSLFQANGESRWKGNSARSMPRRKAISLLLDTLDLIRTVSQKTFLESKSRTGRKVNDRVPWEGVPFGIKLQLDGIEVASACMEVRRFPSALFYLDLHLNAQFGKAGGLFEELSDEVSFKNIIGLYQPRTDISGLPPHYHSRDEILEDGAKFKYLKVMSMVGACFKELHEYEAAAATEMQLSSLTLMKDELPRDGLGVYIRFDSPTGCILNNNQQQFERSYKMDSGVLEALQELGLHRTIQGYIEGVAFQYSGLQQICQDSVFREKWFESHLDLHSWNKLAVRNDEEHHRLAGMTDETEPEVDAKLRVGFFESVSRALASFSRDDLKRSFAYLKQARLCVIDSIVERGGEHLALDDLVDVIDKVRALKDLDELMRGSTLPRPFDFSEADMLLVALGMRQVSLAAKAIHNPGNQKFAEALKHHLQESCSFAIARGMPCVAENALSKLRLLSSTENVSLEEQPSVDAIMIRVQEAKVMECRGDFITAIQRMKQLVGYLLPLSTRVMDPLISGILADTQLYCGHWMTKYKTQHARVVLETYLLPGVERARMNFDLNDSTKNSEQLTRGSIQLGHVLANLFDSLLSRIHSAEWKEAGKRLSRQQQQVRESSLAVSKNPKAKESVEIVKLNRVCQQLKIENERIEKERHQILESIPRYLNLSLKYFLLGFKTSGTASEDLSSHIFRMVSLWFSSHEDNLIDDNSSEMMEAGLCEVPSFRFVPLTNQLFSRLEGSTARKPTFQKALQNLVEKMCNDHPYHCLVPLMALANANVNDKGSLQVMEKAIGDSKVNISNEILTNLRKDGLPYVAELVGSYEILVTAYNNTAYADITTLVSNRRTKNVKFSELLKKSRSNLLDQCLRNCHIRPCVLTSPPVLQPRKDYGNGTEDPEGAERVKGFKPTFDFTDSGIHRPRIVTCLGSKGGQFRQLVKGEDPVRQDAIMSQIFNYVNVLMARGVGEKGKSQLAGTRRGSRKIKIATYNISPLSPMSGVLEWVHDTIPLMDYIEGTNSAHSRYYPNEWDHRMCWRHMKGESQVSKKTQSRESLFTEVCSRYSPCFRFFFMDRFSHSAESWHTARMKYTRSVAVNSIVGHVLGIGDRHLSNILIHTKTGVVVHIDFGIVFEQGKLLAIPELVPFRLTRNIVDGMGPCGTEGAFDSAAKETMSTLRENSRDLLTILSAVVADPLYIWQTDPIEARRRQTEKEEDVRSIPSKEKPDRESAKENATIETNVASKNQKNQAAIKTIEKIKQKLEGYEDSTFGDQQGVDGQVQLLINSARDPNLLMKMYIGWAPWI
ncbi:phosphatidylinositol 3- and 4-kinase [Nitzschia inconspicua]|uniref:non-specific serine/threonine protein kinase n=1 Tax=Nitzschia inconspicua TaxID=303405 RepID=A0A9K3LG95_9STRA|nr:phosphatidylinositol 3- and 4-kinase [Nitzschia inconspicua]